MCAHTTFLAKFSTFLYPLRHLIIKRRREWRISAQKVSLVCGCAQVISTTQEQLAMFAEEYLYWATVSLIGRIDKRLLVVLTVFPCLFSRLKKVSTARAVTNLRRRCSSHSSCCCLLSRLFICAACTYKKALRRLLMTLSV